jgi:hypothetical protein
MEHIHSKKEYQPLIDKVPSEMSQEELLQEKQSLISYIRGLDCCAACEAENDRLNEINRVLGIIK